MQSCIYEGRVSHCRFSPVKHQFQYRLFMVYLDLAELPDLLARPGLIADCCFSSASFLRGDHLKDSSGDLDLATRDLITHRTGVCPRGPIRLLTQLRYFGYYFSPLNLYFCFDPHGDEVESVVAEVNNTPWREQHCYVLWEGNRNVVDEGLSFTHKKSFHVSPFMDMNAAYHWKLSQPGASLELQLTSTRGGKLFFRAGFTMTRYPLTRWNLNRSLIRYPLMTAQIVAAIYYQALRLWMKKCPFYPHPQKNQAISTTSA